MAGLQARLDTAFGALGDSSDIATPWRPAQQNIFRSGPGNDNASSDDEYTERLRREVVSGMAMDLGDEEFLDAPNEEGLMPSAAFCRQVDQEEELDGVDTAAAFSPEEYRPAPGTEVLEGNIYDQRMYSLQGGSPMEEEEDHQERSNNYNEQQQQQQLPSPQKPRLVALSSRGPSKSNLRTSSTRQTTMKKRVSFTGIAEPPVPWVPPHKRGNFVSKFKQGCTTLPPSPAGSPPKFPATSAESAAAVAVSLNNKVPDYVANPERYTRYELETPLVVGGGVGQLSEENDQAPAVQDVLTFATAANVDIVEEERWQGTVGGGIEFRPRVGSTSSSCTAKVDRSAKITSLKQHQKQVPSIKASFTDFDDDEELEDAS